MTLPTSGNPISFLNLKTEFNDTDPVKLSDYYAGGPFVFAGSKGYPGGVETPIPSSGQISLKALQGAMAEGSGGMLMTSYQTYIANQTRNVGNSYQIDPYEGAGLGRYTSNPVHSCTWSLSGIPKLSGRSTVIAIGCGTIYDISGISVNGTARSLNSNSSSVAVVGVVRLNEPIANITSSVVTYSSYYENRGGWSDVLVLQGHYQHQLILAGSMPYNRSSGDNYYYDLVLPPGAIVCWTNYAFNDYWASNVWPDNINTVGGVFIRAHYGKWYNAYTTYFVHNTSDVNKTLTWHTAYYDYGSPPVYNGYGEVVGGTDPGVYPLGLSTMNNDNKRFQLFTKM
jgi:hypothetical protein